MIDRKKGPKIVTEFDLTIKGVETSQFPNGMELYEVNEGTQDIIKIDFVFKTGRIHEKVKASAKAAISLIREGSTRHSAQELAQIYDFYGAVVKSSCTMEYVSVNLVVVERYFEKVWPVFFHMLFYPLYPQEEIAKYAKVNSQKLNEQLSKNEIQAYRKLTEEIFGSEHPYGYNTEPSDIAQLSRKDILDFYNLNLGLQNCTVILSGKYSQKTRKVITAALSECDRISHNPEPQFYDHSSPTGIIQLPTNNEIQTSIKMGRSLFPISHPDYGQVKLMDMILGGYFGSRLMKNIREEKGYTYGIYSSAHCWNDGGFLYISADVDNKYVEPTLLEIKKEMELLRSELVSAEEFQLVKNYILGQSLHLLDGPFAKGALVRNLRVKNQTLSTFKKNVENLKAFTPENVRDMAIKYLNPKDYLIVQAGRENQS